MARTYKKFQDGLKSLQLEKHDLDDYIEAYEKRCILDNSYCVCGHLINKIRFLKLKKNKLILDEEKHNKIINLLIGSCCIKRFLPEGVLGNHCVRCDKIHKNRITNKCNDCKKICEFDKPMLVIPSSIKKSIIDKPMPIIQPNNCLTCKKPCSTYKWCYLCYKKTLIN